MPFWIIQYSFNLADTAQFVAGYRTLAHSLYVIWFHTIFIIMHDRVSAWEFYISVAHWNKRECASMKYKPVADPAGVLGVP